MIQRKIKTLIEIDRDVWSLTRAFATSQNYNISDALKELLTEILQEKGFFFPSNSRGLT
jgi:hypothetical protein